MKTRGLGPKTYWPPYSRKKLTPMAVMREFSRGELRSGRYASRSMKNPRSAHPTMEARVMSSAPPMLGSLDSPVQRATYQPTIAPIMKTSPWAKLISFKTPYTMV